jgi:pseudomonalisin
VKRALTAKWSRTLGVLVAGVAAVSALAAFALSPVAGATNSQWSATHTRALRLAGQLLGRAPATQSLEISAVLPLRNAAAVNRLISSQTILSPAEVRARFSPTSARVATVERYLRRHGFRHLSVAGDRLLITGQATVAQA